jgi:hypothetical protein
MFDIWMTPPPWDPEIVRTNLPHVEEDSYAWKDNWKSWSSLMQASEQPLWELLPLGVTTDGAIFGFDLASDGKALGVWPVGATELGASDLLMAPDGDALIG